MICAGDAAQL